MLTKPSAAKLLLAMGMSLLGLAKADDRLDQERALQVIASAAHLDDYAKYQDFFDILGLAHSNPRTYEVRQEGVETPTILGTAQEMDLMPTSRTELSKAIKTVEFRGFIPVGQTHVRMHLFLDLDPNALCIYKSRFMEAFGPLKTVYATDLGPSHLEREFFGPNHRWIGAYFDNSQCAVKVFLTQDPYQ